MTVNKPSAENSTHCVDMGLIVFLCENNKQTLEYNNSREQTGTTSADSSLGSPRGGGGGGGGIVNYLWVWQ